MFRAVDSFLKPALPTTLLALGLMVALAACGDDATGPGGSTGDIPVSVVIGGDPLEGVVVFHNDASGHLIDETETSPEGAATVTARTNDMVSVSYLDPQNGSQRIHTVTGVVPGRRISFASPAVEPRMITATVTVTGDVAGSFDRIEWATPCGPGSADSTPFDVQLADDCAPTGGLTMLLHTTLADEAQMFAPVIDRPYDRTGSTTIDVTGLWSADWQPVELALPSLPAAYGQLDLSVRPVRDGVPFQTLTFGSWTFGEELPTSASTRMPRGFTQMIQYGGRYLDSPTGFSSFSEWASISPGTAALPAPPPLAKLVRDGLDWNVKDGIKLAWKVENSTGAADAIRVHVLWTTGGRSWAWSALLPPTATSFEFPELPAALAASLPASPTIEFRPQVVVELLEDSRIAGFPAFQAAPLLSSKSLDIQPGVDGRTRVASATFLETKF